MPTLKELSDRVDDLQTTLDDEQAQIQSALDKLTQAAADLQTQLDAAVAAGGTDADRQAVLDKLNSAITDLQATVPS